MNKEYINYCRQQRDIYTKKYNKTKSKIRKREYQIIMEYYAKEIESLFKREQERETQMIKPYGGIR